MYFSGTEFFLLYRRMQGFCTAMQNNVLPLHRSNELILYLFLVKFISSKRIERIHTTIEMVS